MDLASPVGAAAGLPCLCGLRAIEARLISALIGGRALFFWFSVQVCRGGALLVAAALLAIMSLRLQPHLDGDVEKLV